MASDNIGSQIAQHACKCLNIRITPSTPTSPLPEYPHDQVYTPVFAKEDGITVAHPQATVRLTSKPERITGSTKHSRFTSVTCLFCDLAIYRVHQTISLDVEGNETILLPTEEWVEQEILKSATGWIDVHTDSIVGNNISTAESSSSFVTPFSLLLPHSLSPLSPPFDNEGSSSSTTPSPEAPPKYMTNLKQLFLPPPFTSSHPIFMHLASIADETSKQIRAAAEERIADFIKAETVSVEKEENILKGQVEAFWKNYKGHLQAIQKERDRRRDSTRSSVRLKLKDNDAFSHSGVTSPLSMASSVKIRNFIPQPVAPAPLSASISLPRVSALSASLVTSHFHHPRVDVSQRAASPGQNSSNRSRSTSQTESSTLVHSMPLTKGINILEFKPNLDEGINTQATYRFFVIEEEMKALQKRRKEASRINNKEKESGPSQVSTDPITDIQVADQQPAAIEPPGDSHNQPASRDATPTRGRDKGKRKVAFNVKPAALTFKNGSETQQQKTHRAHERSRDMIFGLADFDGIDIPDIDGDLKQTVLPLREQPASRSIRARTSRPKHKVAMDAFAYLRPASLPNPSHIRPMRSHPGFDSSSQSMLPPRVYLSTTVEGSRKPVSSMSPTTHNEHDAEILKLEAANTPSHRGAWNSGSRALRSFTRRQNSEDQSDLDIIDEEENSDANESRTKPINIKRTGDTDSSQEEGSDDDEDSLTPYQFIRGSLPVNINRPKPREQLSLSSYLAPSVTPSDSSSRTKQSGFIGRVNSVALHNAAYAERDRNRGMDPGELDFVIAEEEDEEDSEDDYEQTDVELTSPGEKARKHARRILQARSKLPEEGMWRSLA